MKAPYHGSIKKLPLGCTLAPQTEGYTKSCNSQELEGLFESLRPENKIPRSESVYQCNDVELIDLAGGYTDFIYQVEPEGVIEESDLAWYTQAQIQLEDGDRNGAIESAKHYWSGKLFVYDNASCLEYRCRKATLLKQVS